MRDFITKSAELKGKAKIGRLIIFSILLIRLCAYPVYAQGVFTNDGNGNWQNSSTWTFTGSDADGVPDADDDVIITDGARVNIQADEECLNLTLIGRVNFSSNNRTLTVNGDMTVSGTNARLTGNNASRELIVDNDLTIGSGFQLSVRGQTITVSGTTTIDGTLRFVNSTAGTKTFANIVVNATGTWDNGSLAEDFTITGDITNNGTWDGCSNNGCDYTLTSTSGTIAGSGTTTVSDIIIDGSASYTNTGYLAITDDISGTGTFVNGNGGTLELQGGGPFTGTSTFTLSTVGNTVVYGGGGGPEILAESYYNLSVNKSGGTATLATGITVANDLTVVLGNLDIDENLTVSNDVVVQGGVLEILGATLTVGRDLSVEGGEFTPNNASADVDITRDLLMSAGTYDHNNGAIDVTGDLTITGGTMDLDGGTFTASDGSIATGTVTWDAGTVNINNAAGSLAVNSGSLDMNGALVTISGTYDVNGGTNDLDGGTLNAVNIDIESGDQFTASNATLSHTGTLTANGTMTFDNGSGSYTLNDIVVASGGTWNVTAASDFTINGDITYNGTSWTACSNSNCDYTLTSTSGAISGSGAFTITDVVINGSASYTHSGNLTISDRLTGTGTFINGSSGSFTYTGNNVGNSNFDITTFTATATDNIVIYGRAGDQELRVPTSSTYYNLVMNTDVAGDDVTLTGNVTVSNQLTLTTGDLILSTNRLTLADGASVAGGNNNSYVQADGGGVLRQEYSTAGSTLSFPLGDNNDYSPITALTINTATFGASPYLEFSVTDANHPNRNTSNTPTGDDDGTAAVDYISRYWTVAANDITDPDYNVSYQYLDADITGIESNMVGTLYRIQPTLLILDWFVTGIVDPSSNTVSLTGADAFGDLYAMDNTSNRLPITLLSFEGSAHGEYVEIQWVTATEENNDFFTLERSANAQDFEPILHLTGAGHSQELLEYSVRDEMPLNGRAYYRLKQTDFNGTFTYSELISVVNESVNKTPDIRISKNPVSAGEILTIERARAVPITMVLVSMNGRVEVKKSLGAESSKSIELRIPYDATPGLYVLGFYEATQRQTFKLWVR